MNRKFYVYEHWRPDLDLCFYVGKGQRNRATSMKGRHPAHQRVVADLSAQGMCVEVRMVESGLTEEEAFDVERYRIGIWREMGVGLVNQTDGGEGFSGFVRPKGIRLSEETKRKMSAARIGMKFSPDHRANLAARKIGIRRKPFTEETRAKMRAASAIREARKRELHGENVTRWSKIKEPT